jgi:protein tyrosine phosphatase
VAKNREHFLNYTDEALIKSLQHLNYGDEIDFSKVDANDIRDMMKEMEA